MTEEAKRIESVMQKIKDYHIQAFNNKGMEWVQLHTRYHQENYSIINHLIEVIFDELFYNKKVKENNIVFFDSLIRSCATTCDQLDSKQDILAFCEGFFDALMKRINYEELYLINYNLLRGLKIIRLHFG